MRFDMRLIHHADEITYVRALRYIMDGTEDDRYAMRLFVQAAWTNVFNKFYLVRDVDD